MLKLRNLLLIIFGLFLIIGLLLAFVAGGKDRPEIILSGRIIYDEFKKGDIELYWTSRLNAGGPPDPRFQRGLVYLPRPGPYRFNIPKNYGNIYVCARNKGSIHESFAYYISDALKIGSKDIRNHDITLRPNRLLMDSYKGPTVELSGKVFCSRCREGEISVSIFSADCYKKLRLPPDIAKTVLGGSENFSLDVPKDVGEIYLVAINVPKGEKSGNSPLSLHAAYQGNPLKVTGSDINGIEIDFN